MRRSWLNRVLGRVDTEQVRAELAALADSGDWAGLLAAAQEALKPLPTDVVILNLATRAKLTLAEDSTLAEALAQAEAWLAAGVVPPANNGEQAPVPADQLVEADYLKGWVAWLRGSVPQAEQSWRRAWEAKPGRDDVRDALVRAWNALGRLPAWGVPLVESALADSRG